ncbi:hypothetical protein [Desmospora activa]|uniref:Uncharacterized protein DUF2642 n=1 Tax=Desmospora activa DSM 45169 TaxID=1121389 RepID=A0A2T4ZAE5_9BACL|nr:hypothetical protein [Desmospora activa]PTM58847.1 uncharacterized protein DUF2642 [Desmospora activa DSM 45169]
MLLYQRLRQFIGSQVEVMTAAGLTTGRLLSAGPATIVVQVSVTPGYPPATVTIHNFAIGFIRIIVA